MKTIRLCLLALLFFALSACDDSPPSSELSPDNDISELEVDPEVDADAELDVNIEVDEDAADLEDELDTDTELVELDTLDDELELPDDDADFVDESDEADAVEPYQVVLPEELAAFYVTLESLDEAALRDALLDYVDEHIALGYDAARDQIYGENGGVGIDLHDGVFECIYSGRTIEPDGTTYPKGTCTLPDGEQESCSFNTEHTWPSSALVPPDEPTGRGDLHHIFPCWSEANNRRSNFNYGEPNCTPPTCNWDANGSYLGRNDDDELVFHVRLARRGDVARAQFYMSVRYQLPIAAEVEDILRQWHLDDPVDEREFERNNAIEALQQNRNPFIDRTDFVDLLSDF
ncbi:MAG: endonuclease [Myxococcota bacterium]|jgi:hypothetical protein|nr:endonuclease [Myxococcota bacterium]